MDEKPVTADVVVACLFAGVGAWGAKVVVEPVTTYASELFGEGHGSPEYMKGADGTSMAPMVVLTIPSDGKHNGSAEIEFVLDNGAVFNSNIAALMWKADADSEFAPAPGAIVSIVDGGRAGESSIKIKVEEASSEPNTRAVGGDGVDDQAIAFELPRLKNLGALAHAGGRTPVKAIKVHVTSRVVSGAFTDSKLSKTGPNPKAPGEAVMMSRDSLMVMIEASGTNGAMKTIAIDDDADEGLTAFKSVKEKNKDGYVELATVTIATQQVETPAKAAAGEMLAYYLDEDGAVTPGTPKVSDCAVDANTSTPEFDSGAGCYNRDDVIFKAATSGNPVDYYDLYDFDGELIDEGLRGNFMVTAKGTRDLFNEGDILFVDYDRNGMMGGSEEIVMGTGSALSIDADKSESFPDGVTGTFKVYYMPGGKETINHGSTITLDAMVDYSDPSANDESAPKPSTTMLNFDGVTGEVKAYAIAQTDNGRGDSSNLRVRCEASTDCRVFLECWGDDGTDTRRFGEVEGGVPANGIEVWNGAAIESVTGRMPDSRHSCRVLSKGMVTVQQLTRSGGVLVNNTYVGDGM